MKRTTQDDSRENRQIEIFGLTPGKGRSNKYIPDASIKIKDRKYFIELKTSDIVKKAVSTARDFGLSKIEDWCKNDGFIISQYKKTDGGFTFTKHYFLTPDDLKPFFDKIKSKIEEGFAGRAGSDWWNKARKILIESGIPDIAKGDKTFLWGSKLNDPRISWSNIEKWGTEINKPYKENLVKLLGG